MRRRRGWVLLNAAALVVALTSCGSDQTTTTGLSNPFSTLTAAQFHAIGVDAGAAPLGIGETAASRLDVTDDDVDTYVRALCQGPPPVGNITMFQYPKDVPAFEAIFATVEADTRCDAGSDLDTVRGSIGRSIASNQQLLARIDGSARATEFCDAVDHSETITSSVLIEAMTETRMVEGTTEETLAELGITLLLKSCPTLVDRLG